MSKNNCYMTVIDKALYTDVVNICDALQQDMKQVPQAYFEICTIEVNIG